MKNNNLVSGSIIFILLMLPFFTLAQETQHEKDSLRKVISSTKGEDKLKAYQVLSNLYYYESYNNNLKQDTLFAIYKEMKKEAEQQGEFKYAGFTLTNTLTVYESNKNSPRAS